MSQFAADSAEPTAVSGPRRRRGEGAFSLRSRRGPFLRPLELVAVAAVVGALLFAFFPGADFGSPRHLAHPDDLSVAYLRLVLRAHPQDGAARLLLAKQLLALGRWDEAAQALAPLVDRKDQIGVGARLGLLRLDRARLAATPPGDPVRPVIEESMRRTVRVAATETRDLGDMVELADVSLALGDPGQAAALYDRLAALDRPRAFEWSAKAARWYTAAGQGARAAASHAGVARLAPTSQARREGALAALAALEAAGHGRDVGAAAAAIADHFPDDAAVLAKAAVLALGAGDLRRARAWAERAVALGADDDASLERLVQIHLGAGDARAALPVVQRLLERHPDRTDLRRRYADVATWSGQPRVALAAWAALARRGSEDARQKALSLARQLYDTDREIEMLQLKVRRVQREATPPPPPWLRAPRRPTMRRRPVAPLRWRPVLHVAVAPGTATPHHQPQRPLRSARTRPQSDAWKEVAALADALEAKGDPARAISVLDSVRYAFKDRAEYWARLAALYENTGDLERALACAEAEAKVRPSSARDAVRQAKLLWRLHRPEAALTRLVGAREQADPADAEFWRLLADLAWLGEQDAVALEAFRALWRLEKTEANADRLIRLLHEARLVDEMIAVTREGFAQTGRTEFLIAALDAAATEERWDVLRQLLDPRVAPEDRLAPHQEYWFDRGLLAAHDRRPAEAERCFRRTLELDALHVDAARAWLDLAITVDDRQMARRALAAYRVAGEDDPSSWRVLAEGYALVGDDARARHFQQLRKKAGFDDTPTTPDERLQLAIDRGDRATIARMLRESARELSLASRVSGERELGNEERAWSMLREAGLTERVPPDLANATELAEHVRELREEHLAGTWVGTSYETIAQLDVIETFARLQLGSGALTARGELDAARLSASGDSPLLDAGTVEVRGGLALGWRASRGDTTARAAAYVLPTGTVPHAAVAQTLHTIDGRYEARVEGVFDALSTETALMRVAGLRDGVEAELRGEIWPRYELVLSGEASRWTTRERDWVASGALARIEAARRFDVGNGFLRLRVDALASGVDQRATAPASLAPFLRPTAVLKHELPVGYRTAGVGLSLSSLNSDIGDGRAPRAAIRYLADVWGGRLWPADKTTFALEGGIGLVVARYQELAATGFFYTDTSGVAGRHYAGWSLRYVLRWF